MKNRENTGKLTSTINYLSYRKSVCLFLLNILKLNCLVKLSIYFRNDKDCNALVKKHFGYSLELTQNPSTMNYKYPTIKPEPLSDVSEQAVAC